MKTGQKTHVINQLRGAIASRKEKVTIKIINEGGKLVEREVKGLPKVQTSGTAGQQLAHANQLAQNIVKQTFSHLI